MDALIKYIGTYEPPPPSTYGVTRQPVYASRQNARGKTIGEFLRWRYYVNFGYKFLTDDDYKSLCDAVTGSTTSTFFNIYVQFWDPITKAYREGYFISPSISALMYLPPPDAEYQGVEILMEEQ